MEMQVGKTLKLDQTLHYFAWPFFITSRYKDSGVSKSLFRFFFNSYKKLTNPSFFEQILAKLLLPQQSLKGKVGLV